MNASERQRGYIASLIKQYEDDYPTLRAIFKATPRNNEKYPDERCDYTQVILADNLKALTQEQADFIINALLGKQNKYNKQTSMKTAFNYLVNLKLV